jgi:hypothetical protein
MQRSLLLASSALVCAVLLAAAPALAQDNSATPAMAAQDSATTPSVSAQDPASDATDNTVIVTGTKPTRSATTIPGSEIQKILPGVSPLRAIETLPGVLYITSDPWGNNEQNAQIFIHGFASNQLGYTFDGVPLGDLSYGNYNGLAPERAAISENVGRVVVTTGAGDLSTPSSNNLGGTIETYSSDPLGRLGAQVNQTVGSYGTSRTYARIDLGDGSNSGYIAGVRQRARAWDFNGVQGGWQANAKFVHDGAAGKLTLYFDYSDMKQPNEDATTFRVPATTAAQAFLPYTRPFFYNDLAGIRSYMDAYGNTPAAVGSNYRNYYSDAQRTDYLAYARYDAHLGSHVTWSTTGYYHHNDGAGVVNGPLGQSITVVQAYLDPNYANDCHFGTNANGVLPTGCSKGATLTAAQAQALGAQLVAATGGSGLLTRTTEYRIERYGVTSNLAIDLGAHQVELGGWYEHNDPTQWRRWYAVPLADPAISSPYIRPLDAEQPLFTQYQGVAHIETLQLHAQDSWRVFTPLLVQFGLKTSAQWASGEYPIQPAAGSLSGTSQLPNGRINTLNWFLPSVGATYDLTGHEQLYANIQKNLHQFPDYLAGGGGPWFTGSQAAFNTVAAQDEPESSWTYEAGLRTHRSFGSGFITGFEAQVNYYHVVFNNRQLAISTNPGGIAGGAIAGGTSILVNAGSVHTDGIDAAGTLRFGRIFSLYNALSFNKSTYQSDYTSTASGVGAATGTCIGGVAVVNGVVPTCGKQLPGTPKWLNKTVASLNLDLVDVQLIGDYVGRRYATYTDDTSVPSFFQASARVALHLPQGTLPLRKADLALNVTNLFDTHGWSTVSIGSATNTYSAYPIAPRQWFLTLSGAF